RAPARAQHRDGGPAMKKTQTADEALAALDHPLRESIEALRAIIRAADRRLVEGVKWNAPSYSVDGHDRITFNLHAKDRVRLIFHRGARASAPSKRGRVISDAPGLLEWASDDRAIATFTTPEDVAARS